MSGAIGKDQGPDVLSTSRVDVIYGLVCVDENLDPELFVLRYSCYNISSDLTSIVL